jgi:O-antigen/teichoic acid export membrane protein
VLYAMQSPRLPLLIYGACGAFNLVGDLVLIPRLGARGAVLATGAAMLGAGLASGLVIRRRTGAFFPVVFALKVLGAAALGALLARVMPRPAGLAGLLVAAAVVCVVTLVSLRLLRPLGEDDRRLLIKLSPRLEWLVARL